MGHSILFLQKVDYYPTILLLENVIAYKFPIGRPRKVPMVVQTNKKYSYGQEACSKLFKNQWMVRVNTVKYLPRYAK